MGSVFRVLGLKVILVKKRRVAILFIIQMIA